MVVDKENVVVGVTTLESLPVDIRTDIFSRLDAKTLTRFLCVSKPFSSFVSTPEIIAAHRLRTRLNPRLLFRIDKEDGSVSLCYFDINTKDIIQVIQHPLPEADFRVQTCLELVCVCKVRNRAEIRIWNPTNNSSLSLPPLDVSSRYPSPKCVTGLTVSFGYVASTNEYKVLCITSIYSHITAPLRYVNSVASIFTIGTDKFWRDVEDAPLRTYDEVTVCNEVVYCLTHELSVISFDLAKEKWSVLPVLPFVLKQDLYLTELGGHLCLVQTGYGTNDIDIWMLQNVDTFSWSKEFHIDISTLINFGIDCPIYARVLIIDKEGRILMYLNTEEKLVYYDPRSGNFEDFHIREKLSLGDGDDITILNMYLDSLMSLEYHS